MTIFANLPGVPRIGDVASRLVPSNLLNFTAPSPQQLVNEAAQKVNATGQVGLFNNYAQGAPIIPVQSFSNIDGAYHTDTSSAVTAQSLTQSASVRNSIYEEPDGAIPIIVRLVNRQEPGEIVEFVVSPKIDESRTVDYEAVQPIHHPGVILKYKSTGAREWTVAARLIVRTEEEATKNHRYINWIRSWAMPYYGVGTQQNYPNLLGAPPPILTFSGYGVKNIGPIPVILSQYSWSWPNDVDWLPADDGTPFPVLFDLSLTLREAYSPAEFTGFNLRYFKEGILPLAWLPAKGLVPPDLSQARIVEDQNAQQQAKGEAVNLDKVAGQVAKDEGLPIEAGTLTNRISGGSVFNPSETPVPIRRSGFAADGDPIPGTGSFGIAA